MDSQFVELPAGRRLGDEPRQPEVAAYIRDLHATAQEEARQDAAYSLRQTLAYLARIIETSAGSISGDDPLIQHTRIFSDGSTSVRIPCKLRALKMYAELAGYAAKPAPPKPIDPRDTPMAHYIHHLRATPRTHDAPSHNNTPTPPSTSQRATGRAGLSEPADDSCNAYKTKTSTARAHAKPPTPENRNPTYHFLPSETASPAHVSLRDHIAPPPILAWPDDPVCQGLLGNHCRPTVIR